MSTDEYHKNVLAALLPSMPRWEIIPKRTALLVIDMQYVDAHPDYGQGKRARELGAFHLVADYFERVRAITVNIRRILDAARANGVEVIHIVIAAHTEDSRDCSPLQRMLGIRPGKSSIETQILEELKPVGDEMVLPKITSSAFNSTPINLILHNMGIDTLILTGVVTNGCVETTARDARDLGFKVILVSDACAAFTQELHDNALRFLTKTRGNGRTTAEVVQEIQEAKKESTATEPMPPMSPGV